MNDFIYLVQGRSDLVDGYRHLLGRSNADVILMTYDQPIDGAEYFPNSTWAEGRNKLLEMALEKGKYLYFVFCDDDISFHRGGWDRFEKQLLKYRPAIGVPVFWKTANTQLSGFPYQSFFINDEQMMAFHHDVIIDGIVLPYQNQFDDLHWWASCEIQEILIQNFYFKDSIQFNNVRISNDCKRRYPIPEKEVKPFTEVIRKWLDDEFLDGFIDFRKEKLRLKALKGTFDFWVSHQLKKKRSGFSIARSMIEDMLSEQSVLFRQYQDWERRRKQRPY